jgi:Ras GTPase-activating protein-binding protein 1
MVMETPSAQCVGREFVRQYYTLLHEAPEYLHRFYSHNSCFVHGGVEKPGEEQPPVTGQADIHKKIMSLEFRDCHAKIRQVDSQPTIANAVVVQVTGELSNNGEPMRRFMQTFVLAPQSPKKYYVHNDIFRYQDEVFHDMDTVDHEDNVASEQDVERTVPDNVQDNTVSSFYEAESAATPVSNGNAEETAPAEETKVEEEAAPLEAEPVYEEPAFEEPQKEEVVAAEPEPEPQVEQPQPQEPPKPFSWAALAGKTPVNNAATASQPAKSAPIKAAPVATKPMAQGAPQDNGDKPLPQRQNQRPQRLERPQRDNSRSGMGSDDNASGERRPMGKMYPDSQQLFVGNLSHNIDEAELNEFFSAYGKVVDVRINRKSAQNREVPNFGFVVFADAATVTKVLEMRPIHLRDDLRLNVEEKKQRGGAGNEQMRPGSGTFKGRGGPGMMGRGGGIPRGRGGAGRGGSNERGRGGFPRPRP